MSSISRSVNIADKSLSYKRTMSDIKDCKKDDFSWVVENHGSEQVGVFKVMKDGVLVRQDSSKPFPPGALTLRDIQVDKTHCKVRLNISSGTSLNDFYG